MTLVQPSGYDLRGIEFTGLKYQSAFYKNFDASYGAFLKNYRSQMTARLSSTVSLEINEDMVWAWAGTSFVQVRSAFGPLASQRGASQVSEHARDHSFTITGTIWFQTG